MEDRTLESAKGWRVRRSIDNSLVRQADFARPDNPGIKVEMQQHEIRSPGGKHKQKRRVGRGDSSGFGSYSGRGMKGQKSRSGGGVRPGFEGGQLALQKKLPKMRGFTNRFRVNYTVVNLDKIAGFEPDTEITPELLNGAGIVRTMSSPIKILGRGELDFPLTVAAHKFSASARRKIEAAGGSVRVIG